MRREDIAMETVKVHGHSFEIPKMIAEEISRLRVIERAAQDRENEEMLARYEAEHGPLPAPEPNTRWIAVD